MNIHDELNLVLHSHQLFASDFMDFSWIFHGISLVHQWINMIRKEIRTLDARKRNTELRGLAKKALQAGRWWPLVAFPWVPPMGITWKNLGKDGNTWRKS